MRDGDKTAETHEEPFTPAPVAGDTTRREPVARADATPSEQVISRSTKIASRLPSRTVTRLGRYEVLFEIARGGMGAVYAGCVRGPEGFLQTVALKVLHRGLDEATERTSLVREATLSARIHHKNVVQTLELGEEGSELFVAMQLVRGVPLSKLVNRLSQQNKRLPPPLAAWITAQAAEGLHAAHELADDDQRPLGLVHRDISPHNILLGFDGSVFVADFGIAKIENSDHSTETGIVKGKFGYMSPEQAQARKLDRRSDIFSLGIVFYESVTGERLFAGENIAQTVLNVIGEEAPPLDQVVAEVSPSLAAVAARCLAKNREARFENAAQLERALSDCLAESSSPVGARDLSALLLRELEAERTAFEASLESALRSNLEVGAPTDRDDVAPAATRDESRDPSATSLEAAGNLSARISRPRSWAYGLGALVAGGLLGGAYFVLQSQGGASSTAAASSAMRGATTASPREAPTASPSTPATVQVEARSSANLVASAAPSAAASSALRGRLPTAAPSAQGAPPPAKPESDPALSHSPPVDTSRPGIFQ